MADAWDQFADADDADPWAQFQDVEEAAPQSQQAVPRQPIGDTGDLMTAVQEPIMSLASGAVAMPIAGLAGIGRSVYEGVRTGSLDRAMEAGADTVESVQGALTYQPRTTAGQVATNAVAYPFEKIAQGADWAGQKVADATGSPFAGAATNTALQFAAPTAAFKGAQSLARVGHGARVSPPVARPVVANKAPQGEGLPATGKRTAGLEGVSKAAPPTIEELGKQAAAAYKRADEAGVVVRENSLKGLKTRIVSMAKKEGLDTDLHPDSSAALNKIIKSKGQLTLSEVETLRKVANDAKGAMKPADKRIASKIVDELDEYIDNLSDTDVVAGDATKAKALKEARDLYSRKMKAEEIHKLVERAEISAPNFSASGMENALRTEFRALAKNEKKMRRFTAEERAAIIKVAKGGKVENALRMIGKFAPTGVVSGVLTGGAATMIGGPLGAAVPIAGIAGRYGATRMTAKNARMAEELMRRGPNKVAEPVKKPRNALAEF